MYLTPLDRALKALKSRIDALYQRFMDDFLIFAPARHKLKAAPRHMYAVLKTLRATVHPDKRFIGATQKGFDFLGYRLVERTRRLQAQGADENRLQQNVWRWFAWLHGGLDCNRAEINKLESLAA